MSAVLRMSTACLSSLRTGFEQAGSVTSLLAAMVSFTFSVLPGCLHVQTSCAQHDPAGFVRRGPRQRAKQTYLDFLDINTLKPRLGTAGMEGKKRQKLTPKPPRLGAGGGWGLRTGPSGPVTLLGG